MCMIKLFIYKKAYHVIYCVDTAKQEDNRQVFFLHVHASNYLTHMYMTTGDGYC